MLDYSLLDYDTPISDRSWSGYSDNRSLFETNVTAYQYPLPHKWDWPWADTGKDMDRAMTQPVKGIFAAPTCEELCFTEGIGQEEFLECIFAKNSRECMAINPPGQLLHSFTLPQ